MTMTGFSEIETVMVIIISHSRTTIDYVESKIYTIKQFNNKQFTTIFASKLKNKGKWQKI